MSANRPKVKSSTTGKADGRQYSLQNKARELGWHKVVVIDEDLGKSASGSIERTGFERLLARVCQGAAGAVLAVEASRLARNGREWHTLLELCGFMETLIIDHDGVYDPKQPNDRLLLGMKVTISEMELSILRQRSLEALRQKAERGELYTAVAVGYLRRADEPERRWNEKLCLVEELKGELQMMTPQKTLSREDKKELMALGEDLRFVWDQAASDVSLKKRILRTAVKEIVISISQGIVTGVVHWEGGDHSEVQFPKSHTGMHRWKTDLETEGLIRGLARIAPDQKIACLLNRLGKKTGKGNSWTQGRVTTFRNDHGIAVYEEGEVERRGEMFLDQAAARLGVHKSKIYKSIRQGLLPATQVCQGAPWIIAQEVLLKQKYLLSRDELGSPDSPLTSKQANLFSEKTTT